MDFFAQQDQARKHTGRLIVLFCIAVALTVLMVYFLPVAAWYVYWRHLNPGSTDVFQWWHPKIFIYVMEFTLFLVIGGSIYKICELRYAGGEGIATMMGGRAVHPESTDFFEKRLRNIVEEMAIASGIPVPSVYLLPRESGINAFVAGFNPSNATIAVTYGAMTGLTRDELQGIIAHEFSHILNNDMRINIHLVGLLHGLLLIGLTGRILTGRLFSGRLTRRSSRENQAHVMTLILGMLLRIIGWIGLFFCSVIKASISRSRERLADASAVQFTRNPDGLAGALEKIGGLYNGSRLEAWEADVVSHMFFCNGLGASLFSTHPPLVERIRWLNPSFSGQFKPVTLKDLQERLIRMDETPRPNRAIYQKPADPVLDSIERGNTVPLANPELLIASIGVPTEQHADVARRLIAAIPQQIHMYTRDPASALTLLYVLLLSDDEPLRKKQIALIVKKADPRIVLLFKSAITTLNPLSPELRLPVLDLAIPSLRHLSKEQYTAFRSLSQELIRMDEKIEVFEYAIQRIVTHHLDHLITGKSKQPPTHYYALKGLDEPISILLSCLAHTGNPSSASASSAFAAAARPISGPKSSIHLFDKASCTWNRLDASLDQLNAGSFAVKKLVLSSALVCLMHDRAITIQEAELFRAIADSLGCPVPPWVVPVSPAA